MSKWESVGKTNVDRYLNSLSIQKKNLNRNNKPQQISGGNQNDMHLLAQIINNSGDKARAERIFKLAQEKLKQKQNKIIYKGAGKKNESLNPNNPKPVQQPRRSNNFDGSSMKAQEPLEKGRTPPKLNLEGKGGPSHPDNPRAKLNQLEKTLKSLDRDIYKLQHEFSEINKKISNNASASVGVDRDIDNFERTRIGRELREATDFAKILEAEIKFIEDQIVKIPDDNGRRWRKQNIADEANKKLKGGADDDYLKYIKMDPRADKYGHIKPEPKEKGVNIFNIIYDLSKKAFMTALKKMRGGSKLNATLAKKMQKEAKDAFKEQRKDNKQLFNNLSSKDENKIIGKAFNDALKEII